VEAFLSADSFAVHASDASHVAEGRQAVQRLARSLEFDETRTGRAAILASEAVSNMLKHAGGGSLVVRPLACGNMLGIELLAIDAGPGMGDYDASARDGHSTTGTSGTGLGAMTRQADVMDVHTQPGAGTIVRMVLWNGDAPKDGDAYELGVVCVAKIGESVCGDAWAAVEHAQGMTILVADGLGHGPDAGRASANAVAVLKRHPADGAQRLLDLAHLKLKPTRGAAVAVVRHEAARGEIGFCGVGNIVVTVIAGEARRAMVSSNGIVGHNVHRTQEFAYSWGRGELLVAHSDGLESQWSLAGLPGIGVRHPSLIAAALFRKHWRKRDDVTVLVARPRA
jgi:anti-sigma regulatory factor (Ser/Thr protein kinase)